MIYFITYSIIFLVDSIIILFVLTFFVIVWICILFLILVIFNVKLNNIYIYWFFVSAKYLDMYWFILGGFFMLCLLLRLCLLLYFTSVNSLSFDICKCVGYQWYWVYYIFNNDSIFSNLILESDYIIGDIRLLQCNNVLTLLSYVMYKFWLSAIDVIHSFTISSLGVKVEIPGRCNELLLISFINGTLYGQCSELCGVLHGFMPIVIYFI